MEEILQALAVPPLSSPCFPDLQWIIFLSPQLCLFRPFVKMDHTVCGLGDCVICKVHARSSMCLCLLPICCWIIFYGVDLLGSSICQLIGIWVVSTLGSFWIMSPWTFLHKFLSGHIFSLIDTKECNAGLDCNDGYHFEKFLVVLQSSFNILHSQQYCMKFLISLHLSRHLFLSIFFYFSRLIR